MLAVVFTATCSRAIRYGAMAKLLNKKEVKILKGQIVLLNKCDQVVNHKVSLNFLDYYEKWGQGIDK